MIYVGIDDTDTLEDPGTNQLARHLIGELRDHFRGRMILRHQLLSDPRVPCTSKNGCASIRFEGGREHGARSTINSSALIKRLRELILAWCPDGSDPGLCVIAGEVPPAIVVWGERCQCELVKQADARALAAEHGVFLEGLGGTQDGVIGALAAVGLMAAGREGRVVYFDSGGPDWYDVTGLLDVEQIRSHGVDEICQMETGQPLTSGTVDVGKRLRPNYRDGRIVLYVARDEASQWQAVRTLKS